MWSYIIYNMGALARRPAPIHTYMNIMPGLLPSHRSEGRKETPYQKKEESLQQQINVILPYFLFLTECPKEAMYQKIAFVQQQINVISPYFLFGALERRPRPPHPYLRFLPGAPTLISFSRS